MTIIPLSEGTFTVDKTKVFRPFEMQQDELENRPAGSLLVEIQPFVVITKDDVLLMDTGLGFNVRNEPQIFALLKANNIKPEQVTKVLLSHLHKDHAGGISTKDASGDYTLSFPNAIYYVQEKELAFALEKGFPSYHAEALSILQNNPNVVLQNGDGNIGSTIRYQVTGGHSPFHQVYWIEEDNKTIFFGGDEAPQLQQMKYKYVAKYDFDGRKSMELRRQWWEDGQEKKWTFLFYHDSKTPVWSVGQ